MIDNAEYYILSAQLAPDEARWPEEARYAPSETIGNLLAILVLNGVISKEDALKAGRS